MPRAKVIEVVRATTRETAVAVGVDMADIDWRGGYRACPSHEAAEGVVRPFVAPDPYLVARAAGAYTQRFLHRLAAAH